MFLSSRLAESMARVIPLFVAKTIPQLVFIKSIAVSTGTALSVLTQSLQQKQLIFSLEIFGETSPR